MKEYLGQMVSKIIDYGPWPTFATSATALGVSLSTAKEAAQLGAACVSIIAGLLCIALTVKKLKSK